MSRIDKKIEELGYKKLEDYKSALYEKDEKYPDYKHCVEISKRKRGWMMFSYESDESREDVGRNVVGLTYDEIKAFSKKMRQMKKRWKNEQIHC